MRAGGTTLTLLGTPRIFLIVRSLAEGPKGQLELRRDAGVPAQSTLRGHLRALEATGTVAKRRRDSFPGALEYELTEPGRELLSVTASLERWLAAAPAGPLELGNDAARATVKGLVDGWATTVLSALAAGPLSLTELDKRISAVSYPTIERCLETMRLAEQLEAGTRSAKGTPHAVTDWLRRGLAPLTFGARWEHRNAPDGARPIGRSDVEAAFMLAAPLLELPARLSGICQLAVRAGRQRRFKAWVELQAGEIDFGPAHPGRQPDAWASAAIDAWFAAMIDARTPGLRLGGDRELAQGFLDSLHGTLFAGEPEVIPREAR